MEGVPRIAMLCVPLKKGGESPNYRNAIKPYIHEHYHEDPNSYNQEITDLESLRSGAVHPSKDTAGCALLKKYFCQLNLLKSRFPLTEVSKYKVTFSWRDVYSETVHNWSDIEFEMSSILYNIGALHMELGALDSRQNPEGMKVSCTHFQCAAWAFQHLRHNCQKYFTPDVSPDSLSIIGNICLAQAQECILEKSLVDNRKSSILAKVALQIVEYYQIALKTIDQFLKDSAQYSDKIVKVVKKWRKFVELKVSYYHCLYYYSLGLQAEITEKWGERVTFLKAAESKLIETIKLAKGCEKTDPIHETLNFTMDVVGGKLRSAEKDNEFVYHAKVPELSAIDVEIKAVSLVKGIPFKFDDPDISGPDIFGRIVPIEAHEASSLYSEEKAKILRTYTTRIEEKNDLLNRFIIPLQLEQLDLHGGNQTIPQELLDVCASMSVEKEAIKRLTDLMSRLSGLVCDVEGYLNEIEEILEENRKKEEEFQTKMGKRAPNNLLIDKEREFNTYKKTHETASESNKALHEATKFTVSQLRILMKPLEEVVKFVSIQNKNEEGDDHSYKEMLRLVGKVEEMRVQRQLLETQLREAILNDDITKQLVVKKDQDMDTIFKEELQKHNKIIATIDQNLLAQDNILRALTEANAAYAETRKENLETSNKRNAVIQSLLQAYDSYGETVGKCEKGIELYGKLENNIGKLLMKIRDACMALEDEREMHVARQNNPPVPKQHHPMPSISMAMNNFGVQPGMPFTPTPGQTPKLKDYLNMMPKKTNEPKPSQGMGQNHGHNNGVSMQQPVYQQYQPTAQSQQHQPVAQTQHHQPAAQSQHQQPPQQPPSPQQFQVPSAGPLPNYYKQTMMANNYGQPTQDQNLPQNHNYSQISQQTLGNQQNMYQQPYQQPYQNQYQLPNQQQYQLQHQQQQFQVYHQQQPIAQPQQQHIPQTQQQPISQLQQPTPQQQQQHNPQTQQQHIPQTQQQPITQQQQQHIPQTQQQPISHQQQPISQQQQIPQTHQQQPIPQQQHISQTQQQQIPHQQQPIPQQQQQHIPQTQQQSIPHQQQPIPQQQPQHIPHQQQPIPQQQQQHIPQTQQQPIPHQQQSISQPHQQPISQLQQPISQPQQQPSQNFQVPSTGPIPNYYKQTLMGLNYSHQMQGQVPSQPHSYSQLPQQSPGIPQMYQQPYQLHQQYQPQIYQQHQPSQQQPPQQPQQFP